MSETRKGDSSRPRRERSDRERSERGDKPGRELSERSRTEGQKREEHQRRKTATETDQRQSISAKSAQRSPDQTLVRLLALYLVPAVLSLPLSLVLALTRTLLNPLYNSIPLSLHPQLVYALPLVLPTFVFWKVTTGSPARETVSARVCIGISALAADLVAVGGRKVGSVLGELLGGQWGATASLGFLYTGVVGGGLAFALLCYDHAWPPSSKAGPTHLPVLLFRAAIYVGHVYQGEQLWRWLLPTHLQVLADRPEKTILILSLFLTVLSFLLRSSNMDETFSQRVQRYYKERKDLPPASRQQFMTLASRLPSDLYPLLILVRLPLLVLVLRQQLYLHPVPPYTIDDGTLRVLHSEQSLTGQIVVAENIRDGYRFMRCDHSILGGRWMRELPDGQGGRHVDLGDSIFGCFPLQEIGSLAYRGEDDDSISDTISLTTELELDSVVRETGDKEERALIIGLGVGIAAASFARKGYEVDIVEIDPAVYHTAASYFDLAKYPISSVNLLSGSDYIRHLADKVRAENGTKTAGAGADADLASPSDVSKWTLVVQDCFSGGSVPGEMFTRDFWQDLIEVVEHDGIVAMNFVGLKGSKASRAVLVTLLSVFEQCRAFSDGTETDVHADDVTNMVVFCTMTCSPLLTFRPPTAEDIMHSPLRSHVYTTFHGNEIHLDSIVLESDWTDPQMMLTSDKCDLDKWQVDTALATWKAMKNILTPEMWLAW